VGYVEWRRLRRQQREWDLTDKQVELRLIDAEFTEQRYSVQNASSKEEELRLYKAKLDGKLRNWQYLVKVSVVNTTSAELLALSADLQIPQFDIERIELNKDDSRPQRLPLRHTYDLLKKRRIAKVDFPVAIPPKGAIGFVFLGEWYFDAPNLVETPPASATFSLQLDDKSDHKLSLSFKETESLEIRYTPTGELTWGPHAIKFPHLYEVPESEDDIPF
jgi:hypothetical protein